ncbi:hypothetical protein F5144DRAFT_488892 [Chaetomium tenue]|uniref:Uncharacterized protein n=1 Tax=Chaetomium tenue TaxID=1854479 RepID=A0ACB7P865_9PEZI|nr:hypothetical protein F5144DRAFT_488892 [Chaetomium globosum]
MDPRDQTFMTIHNLTPDANILFASDSILDILGYQPDEVRGKSAFEYFHPEEVPFARSIHSRGVLLDKAAVLHYARIVAKNGQWMSCECCFTVVHNVLVASTSIYFRGERSERRARDAPQIRRIFSSSPRDPRYHMLEHLSPKFKMPPMEREPRAALILNRFTRNLTIMYATDAVAQILGIRSDELLEKPFYECIQPNCLEEAEKCLESAKANESIAYLRFWYKDPRIDPNDPANEEDVDEMEDGADDRSGSNASEVDVKDLGLRNRNSCMDIDEWSNFRTRSGEDDAMSDARGPRPRRQSPQTFELEAVVSCTSDGLVVVLRRARPPIPDPQPPVTPAALNFENGLFAAPWGQQPIEPYISPDLLYTFRPPLLPQYMPLRECVKAAGGPPLDQLMRSIRDVAVFAWAVTGINPNLAENYGQGGRSRINSGAQSPVDGLPTWDSDSRPTTYPPPGDLSTDRNESPKEPSSTFHRGRGSRSGSNLYASEPPSLHGYRTRHASLDENMYDTGSGSSSSSSRQAGWAATSPYSYNGDGSGARSDAGGTARGYEQGGGGGGGGYHHRRPPLRPAFSYDALHDHARHQQQAYAPASASEAAARRCNFREEIWHAVGGEAAAAAAAPSRSCISSYSGGGGGSSSRGSGGGGGGSGGESSKMAGARGRERYFWE